MSDSILISTYQCARLLRLSKEDVKRLLDSGEIDYFRDEEQVFRIRLDSVLVYATRSQISIDSDYLHNLTCRFTAKVRNSDVADLSMQSEKNLIADEKDIPSDKTLWRVGAAIVEHFRNRRFLNALYKDERLADIMFRYFSGETLEQIGGVYGLTRERIRQLCKKGIYRLMGMLSYFTKDVVEMKVDKDALAEIKSATAEKESALLDAGMVGLESMGFPRRALNVFKEQGINNVAQLSRMSRVDLMRLPNLGRKTLVEIIKVIGKYNLELRSSFAPKE